MIAGGLVVLNYIWAFMILLGVVYAFCTGRISEVTTGALEGAGDALSLCLTMAGAISLWMGLMEIAKQAGLIAALTRRIGSFLDFMFPRLPKQHAARGYIATNLIANVLGLGWACTPAGLKAMEALSQLEEERGNMGYATGTRRDIPDDAGGQRKNVERNASNEMCNFLILNISSLQLISMNMLAYRTEYGSSNPTGTIGPTILATICSTGVAILYCKWRDGKRRRR